MATRFRCSGASAIRVGSRLTVSGTWRVEGERGPHTRYFRQPAQTLSPSAAGNLGPFPCTAPRNAISAISEGRSAQRQVQTYRNPPASAPLPFIAPRMWRERKEHSMPRQKSLVTVIRDMVQQEVRSAVQSLFSTVSPTKPAPNRRRRRRKTRGTWRPGGPGRPPKAVAEKMAQKKAAAAAPVSEAKNGRRRRRRRRGPGRPARSKTKAA